jgi:serine/threonine protein kinase
MGASAAVHPSDKILHSYGLGKLDDVASQSVVRHLEACNSCLQRVADLSSDEFVGRLQKAQVKGDKLTPGWSPSAASSTDGVECSVVSPPPVDTLPPELVDNPDYEIVRELGRGGMGVVYLANNRLMGRPEVLKVVGRHLVERPGVLDRFLREIRSAAMLHHPNIVAAYTAMRLGQGVVLAMEYVEGLDLAKMVKTKGPLPVAHACYFIHQAALGLQHAHERGMVHRDIKPANLILARDGKKAIVKVLDFGLAKVTREGQTDSGLTREGQMLGTPDYIAPEQIRDAQSADIRADIYSLGCTFYYLLTGGPPFRGAHLWDVYQAHFSMDAGPLNLVRPEVPAELAAVVAKMMAKEPERRFQKPAEVAESLTAFFKKGGVTSVDARPEISLSEQDDPKRHSSSASSVPAPSEANVPLSRGTPLKQAAVAPQPESNWGSLIELTEPDSLTDAPRALDRQAALTGWLLPATLAGVVVVGLIAAWGTGIFSSKLQNSETTKRPSLRLPTVPRERTASVDAPLIAPPKQAEPTKPTDRPSSPPAVDASKDLVHLAPASRKADDGIAIIPKPVEPAFTPEKAVIKAVGKKEPVDIRRIARRPGVLNLTEAGAILPILEFWPLLTPQDLTAWQVADPTSIKMNEDGVLLDAGEDGNFLITQRADFKRCKVLATISAAEGTEAYLALRAHTGPDGWMAVTSRVDEHSRKIRAGTQALDFHVTGKGKVRDDFATGKFFNVEFEIAKSNYSRVLINGKETSKENQTGTRAKGYVGAAGLFVKSGRVIIKALRISDSD